MLTSLLREATKPIGLGITELMTKGYNAGGPRSAGSSCILALFSNGCPSLSPGFHPGFGLLTRFTLAGILQADGFEQKLFYVLGETLAGAERLVC